MKILDGQALLAESGLDHFKAGSTFGALGDEAISFLFGRGRIVSLADGEDLFHPDEAGDSFFVVIQGELAYFRVGGDGEVPIRMVEFGEQLGYVSMIGLFPRVGIGRAHGPAVVLEVSSELFYQLHLEFPFDFGIVMLNLSRDMARAIRKISTSLVEASQGHPAI